MGSQKEFLLPVVLLAISYKRGGSPSKIGKDQPWMSTLSPHNPSLQLVLPNKKYTVKLVAGIILFVTAVLTTDARDLVNGNLNTIPQIAAKQKAKAAAAAGN